MEVKQYIQIFRVAACPYGNAASLNHRRTVDAEEECTTSRQLPIR